MKNHLAGIVPLANFKSDFNLPFPPCLLPVKNDWTLIQQAVLECAMAGCNTIWIVANDDLAPIVKKQVGEWIYDPVYLYRTKNARYFEHNRKQIPIYYVAINPKDYDRRDSYGWSALYGIHTAWKVSYTISKWLEPRKYYISFPYGICDHNEIRDHRLAIRDPNINFIIKHKDKIVLDNIHTSFTMRADDFIFSRRNVNKKTTKTYYPKKEGEMYPTKLLPTKDRWSARHFDFNAVFEKLKLEDAVYYEPTWFHDVSSWDGYYDFMKSGNQPNKLFFLLTQKNQLDKMGLDWGEEEPSDEDQSR